MMIKKRLTVSNMLMVFIPVVLITLISLGIKAPFNNMMDNTMKRIEQKNQMGPYYIQDKLKMDLRKATGINDIAKMGEELQKVVQPNGYDLLITCNGSVIYSNLTDNDVAAMGKIDTEVILKANSIVLELNRTSIVKNSFMFQQNHINIIAVNSDYRPMRVNLRAEMNKFLVTYVMVVAFLAIIIFTITNAILTSRISQSIIKPLELLSYGADQIKNGNLDFDMTYESDDEFNQVCSDFDEMRMRLKETVQSNLKYEEDRKELVAGISHDLRTPLTSIKGYVEGLRDGVANTPEKQKKYLDTIFNKACDMNSLVDSLFLFSKLDTGKFPFKFDIINVKDYIEEIYYMEKDDYQRKGLDITYTCELCNDVYSKIDCQEIKRVILNILNNSVKYKVKETAKGNIYLYEKDDNIVFEISDDGEGIDESILKKIFVSFYRADPSRTNPNKGSGLGLAIAKYIVQAHDGSITAFNNNGLTIQITLPKVKKEVDFKNGKEEITK